MITYTSPNIYELMRMNQEMTGHEIDENISSMCVYVRILYCACVFLYVCILYTCVYVCTLYVCIYVCMYICMYVMYVCI